MNKKTHGGHRPGAGRPAGAGPFGEPTLTVRIPVSKTSAVVAYLDQFRTTHHERSNVSETFDAASEPVALPLPFVESPALQAGFPSPAGDYVEDALDLNKLMVSNPPATFFAVVNGDSLIDAGIFAKDIVVVNRSIEPTSGKIVTAVVDGELYIKRYKNLRGRLALVSENEARAKDYPPIYLDKAHDYTIWGVVTGSVRQF
jgi:DNA polymerase V